MKWLAFDNITPGQYICKITDVQDVDDKEYLKIWFDIVKGDFAMLSKLKKNAQDNGLVKVLCIPR